MISFIRKLRQPLIVDPLEGKFDVRGSYCSGFIINKQNRSKTSMRVLAYFEGKGQIDTVEAKYDEKHSVFNFELEIGRTFQEVDILYERVRLIARNSYGAEGLVCLNGASQLALIHKHLADAKSVLYDLDFTLGGNARLFMVSGWSYQERQRCWTEGKSASLRLPFSVQDDRRYELEVRCEAFLKPPYLREQRVSIAINGYMENLVLDTTFSGYIRLVFGKGLISARQFTEIDFDLPTCGRPCDYGMFDDSRNLALAFKQLTFACLH